MASLARELLRRGDECWVVAARTRGRQARQVCEMTKLPRERLVLLGRWGFAEKLQRWLSDMKPEVIDYQHPSGLRTFPVPAGSRAVVTVHGWEDAPAPGKISDLLITVCRLPEDSPARISRRCFEIWNGVDLERFRFHPEPGEGIAFVGRLMPRKMGPLMGLWEHLEQVDIVGPVDRQARRALDLRRLPAHVRLRGSGDPAEAMQRYRVIFGSGLVALEAMAQGRLLMAGHSRAVAPRPEGMAAFSASKFTEGPPETQGRGVTEALEEVRWLLAEPHPELRRFYREYVEQHHDMRKQAARVREVYEEAVAHQ
jgi:glycosyltransferase involved in cell wall biosynthesis